MVRTIPTMSIQPASEDREDMMGAEIAESFKEYIERKERMRLKYKRAVENLPACGTAVFEVAWDALGGRNMWYCEKPECDYRGEC